MAGHNESASIRKCVSSLQEQTIKDLEIIVVDDGSTDNMYGVLEELEHSGQIAKALRVDIRGGKRAALNFAKEMSSGDIVINVDCDCSFERDAIEKSSNLLPTHKWALSQGMFCREMSPPRSLPLFRPLSTCLA